MSECDVRKIGVDIIQPRIAHYRLPLYEGLKRDARLTIKIQASEGYFGNQSVSGLGSEFDLDHPARKILGSPFVWQKKLRLINAQHKGDVLVICGDLHFASNIPLVIQAKRQGVGVLWWGHHRSSGSHRWRVHARLLVTRWISDCVLCYTEEGKNYLVGRNFPADRVFAAGNTIDCTEVQKICQSWTEQKLDCFRRQMGIADEPVILFCSVLRNKTRLDFLLKALAEDVVRQRAWRLVVIGDGEMYAVYRQYAHTVGIDDRIIWVGPLFEQEKLAPWFLSASCFVYPGAIGLSLLHAFGYGLPVVTHDNKDQHGPEFEALRPNHNGIVYKQGEIKDLALKLIQMLSDRALRDTLARNAWRTAHETYSMATMVENFKHALFECSRVSLDRH